MNDKLMSVLRDILELLVGNFGPGGTIVLVTLVLGVLGAVRWYKDWRADRAVREVLAEKERTIQRLANQERTWRRVFLTKGIKLDQQEVNKILMLEQDYENPKQSRKAVEGRE